LIEEIMVEENNLGIIKTEETMKLSKNVVILFRFLRRQIDDR
jgi:hypothetical protein